MSKELLYFGPIGDPSGYSSCCRQYIFALTKLGVKVKISPVRFWSAIKGAISCEQQELLKSLEHTEISKTAPYLQHVVPDCFHEDTFFKQRELNIGYTVFETDGLPPKWVSKINMMHKCFVPCDFNIETFARCGIDPNKLVKIPHIVDTEKINPDNYEPMQIPIKKEFYFLMICDVTKRKGWDILFRAYLREFKGNRDVGLIFKGYFGGVTESHKRNLIKRLKAFKNSLNIHNAPDILFFGDILEEQHLYSLYKAAHCYVGPSLGEGWGLPMSEAMAMEIPVITTNWSGQLEFCKPDNSYLIDILGLQDTDEEMLRISPNYAGQKWAIPSEAHLRHLMREVYENYGTAKAKAKVGRKYLAENFNWKIIGQKIIDNI